MPRYSFVVLNAEQESSEGMIDAANESDAAAMLQRQGGFVESLHRIERPWFRDVSLSAASWGVNTPSEREVRAFVRQFGTVVRAGIPMVEALKLVSNVTPHPGMRSLLAEVLEQVRSGALLSDAVERYPATFAPLLRNLLRVGEASGRLEMALERAAISLDRRHALKSRVRTALTYPVFVFILSLTVAGFLLMVIVPQFASMLEQMGGSLPWMTLTLLRVSEAVAAFGWIAALVATALVAAGLVWRRTTRGRWWWDSMTLRLPGVGETLRLASFATLAEALSMQISTGVPLALALRHGREVISNRVLREALEEVERLVMQGESFASALARQGRRVPPLLLAMVETGEAAGDLKGMLSRIAETYEREVKERFDVFIGLVEPSLILFLGGLVTVIVWAMFLPMYETMGRLA